MFEQTASAGSFLLFVGMVILFAAVFTVTQWQWFRWRCKHDTRVTARATNHHALAKGCASRQHFMLDTSSDTFPTNSLSQENYHGSFYDEDTVPVFANPSSPDRSRVH